jgi:PKD repeat protein
LSATAGQAVQFTATPSGTGDLSRLAYTWDFGDGSSTSGRNPTHVYTNPGTYIASVAATDGNSVATDTVTVNVAPAGPNFTVSAGGPYSGFTNQPIQFYAQVVGTGDLSNVVYTWNFGDGSSVVARNPQHVYAAAGVFTVTLSGSSGTVLSQDTTFADVVNPPPSNLMVTAGGPYTGSVGQPITMTARTNSSDPTLMFFWEFGDGLSGTGATVSHTYTLQGNYAATVTVVSGASSGPTVTPTTVSGGTVAGAATTSVTVGPAAPTGPSVSFAPGWNLVGGPAGTMYTQANGPLYTFQAGDTAYRSIPNTQGIIVGYGYWAYFTAQTPVTYPGDSTAPVMLQAPANQYIMVGNPSVTRPATVTGADVVYIYDPVSGAYANSTTIPPGGGAWALRGTSGSITVTPSTTAVTTS